MVTTYQELPDAEKVIIEPPSFSDQCREWFKDHPADVKRTGRDLSQNAQPYNQQISHVTWNKIKAEIKSADGAGG